MIKPCPRQTAGDVLPVSAELRSTVKIEFDFQFARYLGSARRTFILAYMEPNRLSIIHPFAGAESPPDNPSFTRNESVT